MANGFEIPGEGFDLSGLFSEGPSFPSGLTLGGAPADVAIGTPAALPAAPDIAPADAQPSGLKDFARSIYGGVRGGVKEAGGFAKDVLPFAGLGVAGFGIKSAVDARGAAREQAKLQRTAQQQQQQATQPLVQFGQKELALAQSGQVDPAIQANIDQWAQAAKLKATQWFAHQGITDSTMMQSVLADIDAKAVAMKNGNLQLMEQMGISALTSAAGAATSAAGTAQTEQQQIDALIRQANAALASLTGSTS